MTQSNMFLLTLSSVSLCFCFDLSCVQARDDSLLTEKSQAADGCRLMSLWLRCVYLFSLGVFAEPAVPTEAHDAEHGFAEDAAVHL